MSRSSSDRGTPRKSDEGECSSSSEDGGAPNRLKSTVVAKVRRAVSLSSASSGDGDDGAPQQKRRRSAASGSRSAEEKSHSRSRSPAYRRRRPRSRDDVRRDGDSPSRERGLRLGSRGGRYARNGRQRTRSMSRSPSEDRRLRDRSDSRSRRRERSGSRRRRETPPDRKDGRQNSGGRTDPEGALRDDAAENSSTVQVSSDKAADGPPSAKKNKEDSLMTRTGGAYIPPAKLRMMQQQITDKSSVEYQRMSWEALKKSVNGLVNKVNVSNIANIVRELFQENLVRGRGLLARSIIQAQTASPTFSHVYAALTAIINTKFPQIGELVLKRLIIQFRKGYKRNDKDLCTAAAKFLAHLVNQQVAHEIVALEVLMLLLETPTDDSVEVAVGFLKECGAKLTDVSSRGVHLIFERLRSVLHEAQIDKRVQYMIEVMFQVRKDSFKDHPTLINELDLVEEDDQFTHLMKLDDVNDGEEMLNIFKADPDFLANEEKYKQLKKEILDESSTDEEDGESGSGSSSGSDEDNSEEEGDGGDGDKGKIIDQTETNLLALRRTIYLTIQSSLDFEECAHKLLKLELKPGQEVELCNMILDCCAQQRTFEKFYGLLAQRFCMLDKKYVGPFENIFQEQYGTCHRLETTKLRNVAKFFGHLMHTDAISWGVLQWVKLNEDETTSSSRIFIKTLFQELAEFMGLTKLNDRFKDVTLAPYFEGIFPRDHPRKTRFAINFFTSIGLGGLTDGLRDHLKAMPKPLPMIAPVVNGGPVVARPAADGSSSSSSSSSSDSSSSSSDSSSGSSSSDSDSDSSSSSGGSTTLPQQKRRRLSLENKQGAATKESSARGVASDSRRTADNRQSRRDMQTRREGSRTPDLKRSELAAAAGVQHSKRTRLPLEDDDRTARRERHDDARRPREDSSGRRDREQHSELDRGAIPVPSKSHQSENPSYDDGSDRLADDSSDRRLLSRSDRRVRDSGRSDDDDRPRSDRYPNNDNNDKSAGRRRGGVGELSRAADRRHREAGGRREDGGSGLRCNDEISNRRHNDGTGGRREDESGSRRREDESGSRRRDEDSGTRRRDEDSGTRRRDEDSGTRRRDEDSGTRRRNEESSTSRRDDNNASRRQDDDSAIRRREGNSSSRQRSSGEPNRSGRDGFEDRADCRSAGRRNTIEKGDGSSQKARGSDGDRSSNRARKRNDSGDNQSEAQHRLRRDTEKTVDVRQNETADQPSALASRRVHRDSRSPSLGKERGVGSSIEVRRQDDAINAKADTLSKAERTNLGRQNDGRVAQRKSSASSSSSDNSSSSDGSTSDSGSSGSDSSTSSSSSNDSRKKSREAPKGESKTAKMAISASKEQQITTPLRAGQVADGLASPNVLQDRQTARTQVPELSNRPTHPICEDNSRRPNANEDRSEKTFAGPTKSSAKQAAPGVDSRHRDAKRPSSRSESSSSQTSSGSDRADVHRTAAGTGDRGIKSAASRETKQQLQRHDEPKQQRRSSARSRSSSKQRRRQSPSTADGGGQRDVDRNSDSEQPRGRQRNSSGGGSRRQTAGAKPNARSSDRGSPVRQERSRSPADRRRGDGNSRKETSTRVGREGDPAVVAPGRRRGESPRSKSSGSASLSQPQQKRKSAAADTGHREGARSRSSSVNSKSGKSSDSSGSSSSDSDSDSGSSSSSSSSSLPAIRSATKSGRSSDVGSSSSRGKAAAEGAGASTKANAGRKDGSSDRSAR